MMKRILTYSLMALMTSGITTLALTSSAKAAKHNSAQAQTLPSTNSPSNQMGMTTEVDRVFIEMMIPYHQGANEMAEMALQRDASPEVKELAQKIINEQSCEIEQMQSWYR